MWQWEKRGALSEEAGFGNFCDNKTITDNRSTINGFYWPDFQCRLLINSVTLAFILNLDIYFHSVQLPIILVWMSGLLSYLWCCNFFVWMLVWFITWHLERPNGANIIHARPQCDSCPPHNCMGKSFMKVKKKYLMNAIAFLLLWSNILVGL